MTLAYVAAMNKVIIGLGNSLTPAGFQAATGTNADLLPGSYQYVLVEF